VTRTGVIYNPRSRRNRAAAAPAVAPEGLLVEAPDNREALDEALSHFAQAGVELLVVDGGDGTVREVLTRAPTHFYARLPTLAVLPSGKTNALALDLGAPRDWTLENALKSAADGHIVERRPLEVFRPGATRPLVRGFLLGAGAFVRGTDLAQRAHKMGAFEGLAVGLTLGAAGIQTLFGGARSGWRSGEPMSLRFPDETTLEGDIFLLLASSLHRLPLGVRPFGKAMEGVRTLAVEAPPRRLVRALAPMLAGRDRPWLVEAGYHRRAVEELAVKLETSFVLDGETFPGGELTIRAGEPLAFVRP
jgi:hypothetical protein